MKRTLRPDEARLWARVARSARPAPGRVALDPEPTPPVDAPVRPDPPAAPKPLVNLDQLRAFGDRGPSRLVGRAALHTPAGLDLDPRRRRRIVRERDPIEARIDLHGLDHDQARAALERFILNAYAEGARAVLVITGKGSTSEGVLRRFAPDWLRSPPLCTLVAGVSEADRHHGGHGALYVALKRRRD